MRAFALICLIPLTSCSVMIASDRSGIDPESIQQVSSREQLIELGARPLTSETSEDGKQVEVFLVPKQHGSIARAIIHGALDLSTSFLWEVAATPIETALEQKGSYCVKVTFDENQMIKQTELLK